MDGFINNAKLLSEDQGNNLLVVVAAFLIMMIVTVMIIGWKTGMGKREKQTILKQNDKKDSADTKKTCSEHYGANPSNRIY